VTAADLLTALRRRHVQLEPDGGGLRYRAPAGTLTVADREALRGHRDDLVALLRAESTRPPVSTEVERLRAAYDGLTPEERSVPGRGGGP